MKDISKKILISLSAFILVLSFSFTHLNTSKRFEVQATGFEIPAELNRAKLLAGVLAGLGIKFVQEVTSDGMTAVYNNLNSNAKALVDAFDYQNNFINGYLRLGYNEAQTLAHGLIQSMNAYAYQLGQQFYLTESGYSSIGSLNKTFVSSQATPYGNGDLFNVGLASNYVQITGGTNLSNLYGYGAMAGFCSYTTELVVALGSEIWQAVNAPSMANNYYLGAKVTAPSTTNCKIWWGNSGNRVNGYYPINGIILYANTLSWSNSPTLLDSALLASLASLAIDAGGLTLPAPAGGWADSEPGDVDLEGWTKGLNIPDVGDVVVLGGLAAGTLAGLSPEAVLVPSDSQTPFDPSEEPDYGDEDPYNPPPAENAGWFAAWTAAALGAGSALFGYDPVRDAFAAIQNAIQSIVQPLIDGMTSAFHTMLQTLMQPLVSAFSVMIQGLFALDIPATQLKIEGIRSAIFARIPCVEETLNAWYQIMAVNGSNLISSFTFFGETFSISSGTLLQAFQGFGSMIKQAFRFVFWFIFLKGMRRRVTSFLGLVSAER